MNAGDPFSDEDGINGSADLPAAEGNASDPEHGRKVKSLQAPNGFRISKSPGNAY
jgi:hypothetical protein